MLLRTLTLGFLTCPFLALAQPGCPDPQATNYNAAATSNDGSCLYATTNYAPTLVTNLADTLAEVSGMSQAGGFWWALNDGGNDDTFMRFNPSTGAIGQYVKLKQANNEDWEEMTTDGTSLLIGDFGNNDAGNRTDLGIYRVPLANIGGGLTTSLEGDEHDFIPFAYEDQTDFSEINDADDIVYDCESMIVWNAKIHLFSKNWLARSTTHYVLNESTGLAEKRETMFANGLITGAAISPDSQLVALVGYEKDGIPKVFLWLFWDFQGDNFFSGNKRRIELGSPVTVGQVESIVFTGPRNGYIANERVAVAGIVFAQQAVRSFDVSQWVPATSGSNEPLATVAPEVFPNPFHDFLRLKWPDGATAEWVRVRNVLGQVVFESKVPVTEIATGNWNAGSYWLETSGPTQLLVKF